MQTIIFHDLDYIFSKTLRNLQNYRESFRMFRLWDLINSVIHFADIDNLHSKEKAPNQGKNNVFHIKKEINYSRVESRQNIYHFTLST